MRIWSLICYKFLLNIVICILLLDLAINLVKHSFIIMLHIDLNFYFSVPFYASVYNTSFTLRYVYFQMIFLLCIIFLLLLAKQVIRPFASTSCKFRLDWLWNYLIFDLLYILQRVFWVKWKRTIVRANLLSFGYRFFQKFWLWCRSFLIV